MRLISKYQQGGEMMPAEAGAPVEEAPMDAGMGAPQEGGDPMQMIIEAFATGLQNQDCQALAQGAEMFLQLVQQAQGAGPEGAPAGQPVFAKGGRLLGRRRANVQLVCK